MKKPKSKNFYIQSRALEEQEIELLEKWIEFGRTSVFQSCAPLSPMNGNMWQNKVNHLTPPALQLPGSRLKTSLNARDLELEMELLGLESIRTQQQQRQQIIDDFSTNLSPSMWNNNDYNNSSSRFGDLKPINLEDVFGSLDPSMLSQLQGLSPKVSSSMTTTPTQLQSPTGHQQMRQNSNPLRTSYPTSNYSSSPVRKPTSFGFDSSVAVAQAVMNSRSGAFAKQRRQSFIDHGAAANGMSLRSKPQSSNFSEWGSPDGKLDWGFNGDDANKLRKSASFGFRSGNGGATTMGGGASGAAAVNVNHKPDVSWVNTLVKDVSSVGTGLYSSSGKQRYSGGGVSGGEKLPQWVEQMYIE